MSLPLPVRLLRPCPAAAGLLLVAAAAAQPGVPRPPGLVNEEMWPAPTAADWQRPVLIDWQRSWEDAVALSQASGRPIMICVNMDGEVASEHYAGVRYRQPEIAKLYEPYVCLVASVYRHTPRDHDEHGNRVPCPRFGGVTCGEHIAVEAVAFAKYMDGQRIAPRHIMVELDQKETYDVYYTWDTASVFAAVRDGIAERAVATPPLVRGDRALLERIASPDSYDRRAVERAWQEGDAAQRRALLDAATALGAEAPVEVLRQALLGLDPDLAAKARQAIPRARGAGAVDLVATALRQPASPAERDALIAALGELGQTSERARMLASVHRGLAHTRSMVDLDGWRRALATAGGEAASIDAYAAAARAEVAERAARVEPSDAAARTELAATTLLQALAPPAPGVTRREARTFARLRFADARRLAHEAEQLGASGWRLRAVQAVAESHGGEIAEAYRLAELALHDLPEHADDRLAAEVLALFAEARQDAIAKAAKAKQDWTPAEVADVHAAYSLLARHPFGTDEHVARHYDFLQFFGAAAAKRVLDEGLQRFPTSAPLHQRLRAQVVAEQGPAALEAAYAERLQAEDAPPILRWFAGYATMVAAEYQRREKEFAAALSTYDRAIARYEEFIRLVPEERDGADHYVALALGGKARIHAQAGELDQALADLEASLARREASAATLDGLGITTVDTARVLLTSLKGAGKDDLARDLEARLQALDPALLEPPEYERAVTEQGRGRRGRRRG